jgi:hypothetical protein
MYVRKWWFLPPIAGMPVVAARRPHRLQSQRPCEPSIATPIVGPLVLAYFQAWLFGFSVAGFDWQTCKLLVNRVEISGTAHKAKT